MLHDPEITEDQTYPWDGANVRRNPENADDVEILFRYHAEPGMTGDYCMRINLSSEEIAQIFMLANEGRALSDVIGSLAEQRLRQA
jgi:hypothetical protein